VGVLYLLVFLALGVLTAWRVFRDQPEWFRVWSGGLLGLAGMMWLVALFSFPFGFGTLSHGLALGAMAVIPLLIWRFASPAPSPPVESKTIVGPALTFTLPFLLLCAYLLHTHVLLPGEDGGLYVGQSTFGDLSLHLGIVSSMAVQGHFPPEYSIFPGHRLSYPFLVDSLSSSLFLLGTPLRWAVLLPSLVLMACVLWGFPVLAYAVTRSRAAAILAAVLFFLNGGFGFAYFLENLATDPGNFTRIFSAFYETPTNLVDKNIRWVNVICDMLIPQRTTLAGWAFLLLALWLLQHALSSRKPRYFLATGVVAGLMPMIHTHSFLGLGLVSLGWLLAHSPDQAPSDRRAYWKHWLLYAAIAASLSIPQLTFWTFRQASEGGFVKLHLDWANDQDIWPWFWIKNVGPVFVLVFPALWAADRRRWQIHSGALLVFVVAEIWIFQPNPYDNNKLFYIWYMFACILVGDYLVRLWIGLAGRRERPALAAGVLLVCSFAALLSLGREAVSSYRLFDADEVAAAEFIKAQTPKDSLFLTADNHNNAVAVLTGRNIVLGSPSFLFFHGINYERQAADVARLFTQPESARELMDRYPIDYVYLSDYERRRFKIDGRDYQRYYPIVFHRGGVDIVAVSDRARAVPAAKP